MKIYNQEKTQELNKEEIDFEKGYLIKDKLFVKHYEAVKAKPAVYGDKIEILPNGSTQNFKPLISEAVEAKEAYDEYEDIQVFVPYTEEELKKRADEKRHSELKAELEKIKEDIEQEMFGIVRSDFAEKKARASEIVNELRILEGKEPREVKE